MNLNKQQHTNLIKQEALKLGFLDCGIASPEPHEERGNYLASWLKKGYHGSRSYIENKFDVLVDPSQFLPGVKSVIMVNISYYSPDIQKHPDAPRISRYAFGRDYHTVIREKLENLEKFVAGLSDDVATKVFVDTSPVMEKAMAFRAGLGWTGKHTVMLSEKNGSFFFLGGIMTSLDLEYDQPVKDACGNCTKCIDACPTGALLAPYILDTRKCISAVTMDPPDISTPEELRGKMQGYVYGCDICQEACPWNQGELPENDPGFKPRKELLEMTRDDWYAMDEQRFDELFEDSSVRHYKFSTIRRNLEFLADSENGN